MRKFIPGLAAIALAASAMGAEAGGGVECRIEASNGNGGPRLVAIARVPAATRSEWRFEVRSTGRGGTSSTVQNGGGELPAGRWALLGEVHTSHAAGYEATLELSSSAGQASCRRSGPDAADSGRWQGGAGAVQPSRRNYAREPFRSTGMRK
jgi:hypothetical protein